MGARLLGRCDRAIMVVRSTAEPSAQDGRRAYLRVQDDFVTAITLTQPATQPASQHIPAQSASSFTDRLQSFMDELNAAGQPRNANSRRFLTWAERQAMNPRAYASFLQGGSRA